ncbi:MAG: hypothetical protein ACRCZF_17000 [Gemmataceae bacterium]
MARWRQRGLSSYFLRFGLLCLALELGTRFSADHWRRYAPDDYSERITRMRTAPHEVLLLGGSPVSEGINPTLIGNIPIATGTAPATAIYSLGLPGGTTTDFELALRQAESSPPKLVIYGITASDFNEDRREPHGAWSIMTRHDLSRIWADEPAHRNWYAKQYAAARVSEASALYRHRNGIRLALADWCHPLDAPNRERAQSELARSRDFSTGNGFVPATGFLQGRYDIRKQTPECLPPFGFLNHYRIDLHARSLERIIAWCASHDAELVFVDMPVTADLQTEYAAAFATYRQEILEPLKARGFLVIDAHRRNVGLDDAGFADLIHLNRAGSDLFSPWLGRQLAERAVPLPYVARGNVR